MNKTLKTAMITFIILLTFSLISAGYTQYKKTAELREFCDLLSDSRDSLSEYAKNGMSDSDATLIAMGSHRASQYYQLYGCNNFE